MSANRARLCALVMLSLSMIGGCSSARLLSSSTPIDEAAVKRGQPKEAVAAIHGEADYAYTNSRGHDFWIYAYEANNPSQPLAAIGMLAFNVVTLFIFEPLAWHGTYVGADPRCHFVYFDEAGRVLAKHTLAIEAGLDYCGEYRSEDFVCRGRRKTGLMDCDTLPRYPRA